MPKMVLFGDIAGDDADAVAHKGLCAQTRSA
jgi:hypothetical protein